MVLIPRAASLSPAAFLPPPLHIQKKSRRAAYRRRRFRKPTGYQSSETHACGPLDDIIDEIQSNIWLHPPDHDLELANLDWSETLKPPPPCTITPLFVSSPPSEDTLKVRKSRNNRQSTSTSSMDNATFGSHWSSSDEYAHRKRASLVQETTPWPAFDSHTVCDNDTTGQQYSTQTATTQRRPSRLRLFTNGLARLRRTNTEETSASTANISPDTSPTVATSIHSSDQDYNQEEPSDEAIDAYVRRNARNCHKLRTVMDRVAKRLPIATEPEEEKYDETVSLPTTVRVATRIYPQVKLLEEGLQDLSVAIEIESLLHNRNVLSDSTVDLVFVIDNSYYVTMDCLAAATDAISAALYHLGRGDRIALYTTHCTHNVVTGTRPEQYYPIRSFSTDTERDLRLLIADICRHGTQAWQPARPNPSMTEVVLSIAKSFEKEVLKPGRTHLILLSPATYVLHDVSRAFPDLFIHRLNPGVLPYRRKPESEDTVCFRSCCKNVFVSNWNSYQSVPGCIKRLLKNARCKQPVGQITDVSIDIRLREGCELISLTGDKDVSNLRLGQAHSILAHLRVDAARAKAVDLDSANPIFNSSLDIKGLRNDLQNALALEAVKVHLLDVQLFHRNSISAIDCWNYSETPLILTRDLGGLAPPLSVFSEVVIRQCFQRFSRLVVQDAIEDAERVLHQTSTNMPTRAIVERMAKELRCHQASLQYELDCRQRLPLCAGPIATEISHDWLKDIWEKKKSKRHGMANAKENVTGPAQCIEHLDHRS